MAPNGRSWQVLTWSWACTTGHPASDQVLEVAAHAAWPHALLCAWTFLHDHHAAHDLIDNAIRIAAEYIARNPNLNSEKVMARVKSEIRREAKRLSLRRRREDLTGSASDLESVCASQPEIDQRIYAKEIFSRLSPLAQAIVSLRWLGYSWREIGLDLAMDYSEVRKAYLRELGLLLGNLAQPGEPPK